MSFVSSSAKVPRLLRRHRAAPPPCLPTIRLPLPHLHKSDSGRTDQIGPSRPQPEPRAGRAPGSPEARETRRARVKPNPT
ncbi:hypothetical protein CMUS01_05590 [Colletotrichum musicola]|uniref:Uncharacterized protein n=1 Tax=Colletotrichum musicola TaxID=2175873 RepID=A0A8H6NKB2_9PEZI|nr:hypothetical protein CMUS01_05590 [Colletotrichum musicola]